MIVRGGLRVVGLAFAVALTAFVVPVAAQTTNTGVPNPLQGFSNNREPVHIEAATLEVRDKQKVAIFSGNVHVVQGDTDMRCKLLVVYYVAENGEAKDKAPTRTLAQAGVRTKAALPDSAFGGQQRIRRLEAKGGVVVKRNDQIATGKTGIFDMKSNTVTLAGDVVVSQGPNVTRGDRLVVNLTTGVSRVESGRNGSGRVRALIQPSSAKPAGANPNPVRNPVRNRVPAARKPAPEPAPGQPLRLN